MGRVVRFDGDGLNEKMSDASGLDCSVKNPLNTGRTTSQADKDAADINNILRRYEKTGELPVMIERDPSWGDFSDVPSFQEALDIVAKAEDQFAALDAHVRRRFDNDPAKFLEFASDDKNKAEMAKLGLLKAQDGPVKGDLGGGKAEPSPLASQPQSKPAAPAGASS